MSKKRAHKTLSLEEKLTILDELSSKTHRQLAEIRHLYIANTHYNDFIIIIMIFITSIIRNPTTFWSQTFRISEGLLHLEAGTSVKSMAGIPEEYLNI